jgi:hypothetical protein
MTHTTQILQKENHPTQRSIVKLDISSLDAAGVEVFLSTETDEDKPQYEVLENQSLLAVNVLEWEDESLQISWDSVDGELKVKNLSDGTDVASGTAVGEVVLEAIGNDNQGIADPE